MLGSMRRRDVLILGLLGGIIWYSWSSASWRIKPPPVDEGQLTVDEQMLGIFSKWSGKVEIIKAQSETQPTQNEGTVKGATEGGPETRNLKPETLLPVEQYQGPPFVTSLEGMLGLQQVTIYPEDVVEVFPHPEFGLGSTIRVYRATPVEVTDLGKSQTYRTWSKTVEEFLAEQNIELGENDRIEPAQVVSFASILSSSTESVNASDRGSKIPDPVLHPVGNDTVVRLTITRVAITEVKQEEKIDFKKVEKEDPELPRGQKQVKKGEPGKRVKTFRVTRENGVEVKRELIKNEVVKEPKDELSIIGTKILIGKSFTGRASWFKFNSTRVASDHFKRGVNLRITNLGNGKQIFLKNDGCICGATGIVVDLHPDYFRELGGVISDGVIKSVKIDEVLN